MVASIWHTEGRVENEDNTPTSMRLDITPGVNWSLHTFIALELATGFMDCTFVWIYWDGVVFGTAMDGHGLHEDPGFSGHLLYNNRLRKRLDLIL